MRESETKPALEPWRVVFFKKRSRKHTSRENAALSAERGPRGPRDQQGASEAEDDRVELQRARRAVTASTKVTSAVPPTKRVHEVDLLPRHVAQKYAPALLEFITALCTV